MSDFVSSHNAALAAIAKPDAFFEMLQQQSLNLKHQLALPDHFDFNAWAPPLNWQDIEIFCTEKDAVKLKEILIQDFPNHSAAYKSASKHILKKINK